MYITEPLSEKYFKIFMGAYNDFRSNCKKDYRFELEPLVYDDFIEQRINISLGTILVHEQKVSFRIGMDNNFINLFYRIGYTNYYRQPCENMFTIHLQ